MDWGFIIFYILYDSCSVIPTKFGGLFISQAGNSSILQNIICTSVDVSVIILESGL